MTRRHRVGCRESRAITIHVCRLQHLLGLALVLAGFPRRFYRMTLLPD